MGGKQYSPACSGFELWAVNVGGWARFCGSSGRKRDTIVAKTEILRLGFQSDPSFG
jgi:hypothetical protein